MFCVIDFLSDDICYQGSEKACRSFAEHNNSRASWTRYEVTRCNDYAIAI
jgi:hypothetical protein